MIIVIFAFMSSDVKSFFQLCKKEKCRVIYLGTIKSYTVSRGSNPQFMDGDLIIKLPPGGGAVDVGYGSNPLYSPPFPVWGVVGHAIDRCISRTLCLALSTQ